RGRGMAVGPAGRLGFAPPQDAPAAVFGALDVVVHASTRPEPFGRVIVEAMACGRAVVAAPTGGAAELFDDGVSALACPPGDAGALALALRRLIGDPALRRSLGDARRARAGAQFGRPRRGRGPVRPLAAGRGVGAGLRARDRGSGWDRRG